MFRKVEVVLSLIAEDLSWQHSSTELAQAVNLSPSRLRHLFKEATGVSLTQYFKLHKMQKARELLETSLLSIKEIMSFVRLKDRTHYSRYFKRLYGVTPKEYREQHLSSKTLRRH
jgi:AraC-like DNA-binding protein